ncbi:MAG: stage V sporulation protein SpoVM [Clostridia bacterium]|nr:stage V sporulation protein SpoVM [Clostridia bacterium]
MPRAYCYWESAIDKEGYTMKIVLVHSPTFLTPLLRKFFGIKKEK